MNEATVRRSGPGVKPVVGMRIRYVYPGGHEGAWYSLDAACFPLSLESTTAWDAGRYEIDPVTIPTPTPSPDPGEATGCKGKPCGMTVRAYENDPSVPCQDWVVYNRVAVDGENIYCSPACRERANGRDMRVKSLDPRDAAIAEAPAMPLSKFLTVGIGDHECGKAVKGVANYCSDACYEAERHVEPVAQKPAPWTCSNGPECRTPGAPQHPEHPRLGLIGLCVPCFDGMVATAQDQKDKAQASMPKSRPQPGYTKPGEHARLALKGGWRKGWMG